MPDDAAVDELLAFTMPSLGADMDEGTVLEWLVAPGAQVHHGDVVAVVQTDKSDLDVEVFDDGIVAELVVPVGVKVPVGTVLARLRPLGTTTTQPPAAARPVAVEPVGAEPLAAEPAAVQPVAAEPHVSSPVLRHLAERLHVDLDAVRGTGAGGRITRDDIEHAVPTPSAPAAVVPPAVAPPPAAPARRAAPRSVGPPSGTPRRRASPRARRLARKHQIDLGALGEGTITGDAVVAAAAVGAPTQPVPTQPVPTQPVPAAAPPAPAMDAMRLRIGRLMTKAWQEIPHYQVASRIDLSSCLASLAELNGPRPAAARILPAAVLARAAARAAAAVPGVNGHWVSESFVPGDGVHLAVVVALRSGGLLAPVIHDAADKDIDTLMSELRDLVTRARAGRLRASEVTGATITITELGEGGVESVSPIIHPPQVAIVGLGSIIDQPWAENGMVGVRPVVHATLAGDHRAVDGRLGSLFLTRLSAILQEPLQP